jgi:hypothetical protein
MKAFYPSADELLTADLDQLAETVLRHLKTYEGGGTVHQPVGGFNRAYYVETMDGTIRGLGALPTTPEYGDKQPQVSRRIQEGWQRLMTQGYLMQKPGYPNSDWHVITTEGEELLSKMNRFERWDQIGVDLIKLDLANGGRQFVGGPPQVRKQAIEWVRMKEGQAMLPVPKRAGSNGGSSFIAESRIEELRKLTSPDFDFQKLIRLCEELNSSYDTGNLYATAMLTRAVLDHVPPIFGKKNFDEVASNYGGKSFKGTMQHLNNASRNVADAHLHLQIRKREALPTPQQVYCGQQLDLLLEEIIRITK